MSRIRVMDIAKELGIETKTVILKLQEVGIQVKNHFSGLSELDAEKLRAHLRSKKSVEGTPDSKSKSRVVIRRRASETTVETHSESIEVSAQQPLDAFEKSVNEPECSEVKLEEPIDSQPRMEAVPHVIENREPEKAEIQEVLSVKVESDSAAMPGGLASVSVENAIVEQPAVVIEERVMSPAAPAVSEGTSAKVEPTSVVSTSDEGKSQPNSTAAQQKNSSYSAVIVRKAPPPAPPPPASSSGSGVRSVDVRQQYTSQDRPRQETRFGTASTARTQTAPRTGTFDNTARGQSYQRNTDGSSSTNPPVSRPYTSPEFPRPGFGTRDSARGGTDGARSFGGASATRGGPGARGAGGGFTTPEAPVFQKDSHRTRVDKEKEIQKRRLVEEEEIRKGGALKGRGRFDEEVEEIDAQAELSPDGEASGEVRTVYNPVPNRKRGHGAMRRKEKVRRQEPANPTRASKKVIRVDGTITVNDLAGEMSTKSSVVIKTLMQLGMLATVNQSIDAETAVLVAQEFGFEIQNTTVSISDILNRKSMDHDAEQTTRPPVVTVMGHVDHGKTSLLDAVRSAHVAEREAGGITQHIGAYQVEYSGRKITFLDTPGHEAFTSMRSRGAQVTDVVVLVVAADDGVMPQTIEAINHAKAAQVPIVVAINKIDRPGINIDRIEGELAKFGVTSDKWGGDYMFVRVSAKTKEGIPDLLEAILLQSDVLGLVARQDGFASGAVIEARLDKSRGPIASLLVTQGTLRVSDWIVAGTTSGRVRAMLNDRGERIESAPPATPVEVLGLEAVPCAGDTFNVVANDSVAKEAIEYRIAKHREKELVVDRKSSVEELLARMASESELAKVLPIIIKADTHGSVEAIRASIAKLDTEKVRTNAIHAAVGGITETDVVLASASKAIIVGFNVRPDRVAAQAAESGGVDVRCYSIIYELIDGVQNAMRGRLAPIKVERLLGRAEVRNLFSVPKIGVVAGTAVVDGKILRNSHMRVVRDGTIVYTGRISSLRRFKDDAKEVLQGFECGIGVEGFNDIKVGDVLESFVIEDVAPTLN